MPITPKFQMAAVANAVNKFAERQVNAMVDTLYYIGEEFVDKAKENANFEDDTGNLRSSIGCVVLIDGKVQRSYYPTTTTDKNGDGKKRAREFIQELAAEYNEGVVLVCFAGMQYAAAVESLEGYDVISNSVPLESEVNDMLKYVGLTK